jgi:ABC-type proline/glycine betaine transport system ATPase subunit
MLRWIEEAGAATLLVTHDVRDAAELATVAHVLVSEEGRGRLAASGAPRELLAAPPSEAVARVLGLGRRAMAEARA